MQPAPPHISKHRHTAFTLMEVLVAIGIFAIGMTALASLFPPALLLQKQTVRQMEADLFASNIEAIVTIEGLDTHDDNQAPDSNGGWSRYDATPSSPSQVWPLMSSNTNMSDVVPAGMQPWTPERHPIADRWSLAERSYGDHNRVEDRSLFWIPLIQDANEYEDQYLWRGFFFVVVANGSAERRYESLASLGDANANGDGTNTDSDPTYYYEGENPLPNNPPHPAIPRVMRLPISTNGSNSFTIEMPNANNPRLIRPGEQIVDNNGTVYTVLSANNNGFEVRGMIAGTPTHVWYAAPHEPGGTSTFGNLIVLNLGTGKDVLKP